MNKSLLTLVLVAGLINECHSAPWYKFWRRKPIAEAPLNPTIFFKVAADFPQRTLAIRAQKEFKDIAPSLIDPTGMPTKEAVWLEDPKEQQIVLGHPITSQTATLDHVRAKAINFSKKVGFPLFVASCLGGIGGVYASCMFGGSDANEPVFIESILLF